MCRQWSRGAALVAARRIEPGADSPRPHDAGNGRVDVPPRAAESAPAGADTGGPVFRALRRWPGGPVPQRGCPDDQAAPPRGLGNAGRAAAPSRQAELTVFARPWNLPVTVNLVRHLVVTPRGRRLLAGNVNTSDVAAKDAVISQPFDGRESRHADRFNSNAADPPLA